MRTIFERKINLINLLQMIMMILFFIYFSFVTISSSKAQTGSLSGSSAFLRADGRPMKVSEASQIYQAAPRQKMYQIQDLIHVHVKKSWNYNNTANNQRKKSIKTSSKISAWFKWTDLFSMPVKSTDPLPEIGAELDHKTQNQGNLIRKETLDFQITFTVTSIQDNGNLFVEGTSSERVGEEGQIMYVSGYIRPEDIGPGNTIEGNLLGDLVIKEIPSGNIYDTTRRTWGARWIEHWKPL